MILNIGCGSYINEGFEEPCIGIDDLSDFGNEDDPIESKLQKFKEHVHNTYEEIEANELLKCFVVADAERLPFREQVFDKVFCLRFIGRGYATAETIEEIYEVLKYGGILEAKGVMPFTDSESLSTQMLVVLLRDFKKIEIEADPYNNEDFWFDPYDEHEHQNIQCNLTAIKT